MRRERTARSPSLSGRAGEPELVGFVAFPILFTAGVGPADPGPGAIFVALAGGLGELAFGRLLGLVFFVAFALGALTSAISLTEVVVSYAIDEHGLGRTKAALAIGTGMFLLGAPVTVDPVLVDLYDILAAQILPGFLLGQTLQGVSRRSLPLRRGGQASPGVRQRELRGPRRRQPRDRWRPGPLEGQRVAVNGPTLPTPPVCSTSPRSGARGARS